MSRSSVPSITLVCEVRRNRALDGAVLGLTLYGLGRRTRFAPVSQVPAFDGDVAWFQFVRKPKTRLGVVFLDQVDQPNRRVHWSRP